MSWLLNLLENMAQKHESNQQLSSCYTVQWCQTFEQCELCPQQDIVPGWACPPFRELYNYSFFSSVNAGDGQDTKPDSLFLSLCEITEHNRAYIYTRHKSSGLGFYKSSRWQILLGVLFYLTCHITKEKYIHLRFRPVLLPVCQHKIQHRWRGHIYTHCLFLSISQQCKWKCPIFNQK